MRITFKKSMRAVALILVGLVILLFALLFLFEIIFIAGVWYKENFM